MHVESPRDSFFIFGYLGWRNAGDDAIGAKSLEEMKKRFPKSRIFFTSNEKYFDDEFTSSRDFVKVAFNPISILQAIISTKQIVILGGTHFHDADEYVLRRFKIFCSYLLLITVSRLLGKSPILLGHGFGPISKEWSRFFLKLILWNSMIIAVRDTKSYELACSLGLKERIILGSDPAFLFFDNLNEKRCLRGGGKIIGIELIPVHGIYSKSNLTDHRIASMIALAVKTALDRNQMTEVRVFIMRSGNRDSDVDMAHYFQSNITGYESRIKVIEYDGDLREFLERMKECSLIIGMRYHCLLFALALRKPLIAIIYHEKCRELMREFSSKKDSILEINEITDEILANRILNVVNVSDEVAESNLIEHAINRGKGMFDEIQRRLT